MNITEIIQQVAEKIGKTANVEACFGEPVTLDQQTIIPVASICMGGGGGGGFGQIQAEQPEDVEEGEAEEQRAQVDTGGGGGFGMQVKPVGYIEEMDGVVRFRPIIGGHMIAILALGSLFGIGFILKMLSKRGDD